MLPYIDEIANHLVTPVKALRGRAALMSHCRYERDTPTIPCIRRLGASDKERSEGG